MFETEDMLPRAPPRPSAPPLCIEGSVKPEVPEVSIIFGKQTNEAPISTTQQQPSYAAWKKQVLPHVNYPPASKDEAAINTAGNMVTTRSTVFPLRTTITSSSSQGKNEIANIRSPTQQALRHSLENASGPTSSLNNYMVLQQQHSLENASGPTSSLNNYMQNSQPRRSVDSQRSSGFSTEPALTICASTQTDFTSVANEGSKQELECLLKAVKELQEEQRQTRRLLEAFMMQQKEKQQQHIVSSVFCCDMATQCDIIGDDQKHDERQQEDFQFENGTVHQALPNVKIYSPAIKDISRPVMPTAQSTQYRSNTPPFKSNTEQLQLAKFSVPTNPFAPSLPKAGTEKSMVMNQLALKYLPSNKLNELMQDTHITTQTTTTTPLREIDNFNKAPADISTASFHYLRKYHLLPHQQTQLQNEGSPPQNGFNISNTPTYYPQHQPSNQSPIVVNDETNLTNLDLEHIKRQPKFL